MFNTVISITAFILFAFYLCRFLYRLVKGKSYGTEFIVCLLCLLIIGYADTNSIIVDESVSDAYEQGFNDAIISAELVNVTDVGYTIAFGNDIPEVHHYTADGAHLVSINDHN